MAAKMGWSEITGEASDGVRCWSLAMRWWC
jgi:hypothetical protein